MAGDSMPSESVLDLKATLVRLGGDRELFSQLVEYALEDVPRLFDDIRKAAAAKDAVAVRMSAHALKGLVAGCGGVRAANAAQALETAGQSFDLAHTGRLVDSLRTELKLFERALAAHQR